MRKLFAILSLVLLSIYSLNVQAQLQISTMGTAYTIDFDNSVTGINNGPFESASGLPMFATGPVAGQLDDLGWAFIGDNADTVTMNPAVFPAVGNGNFTTLVGPGVSSTGWGAWNLSGNHALAMNPSGSYSTPAGHLTLKVNNTSGSSVENLEISYYIAAYNDQARANKVIFFYSTDNVTYTKVPDVTFISSLASTASWEFATKNISLSGLSIGDGQDFFLRWVFADHGGSGSRDEFLLDDISITATSGGPAVPTQIAVISVNNGIRPSVATPFTVTVQAQGASGNPTNVSTNTLVDLSLASGSGLLGGNLQGTILTGNHSVVISGVLYGVSEAGVSITATTPLLTPGTSAPFEVLEAADHYVFTNFPATAQCGTNLVTFLSTFKVEARRPDNTLDSNYMDNITLTLSSGPGTLLGTTTRAALVGSASFNDIHFDLPGEYVLEASGNNIPNSLSSSILVLAGPGMTELVVPRYFGSKSAASVNNGRTPFAICLNFNNLEPNSPYDMRLSLSRIEEASTSFGAGNTWNGTAFTGTNLVNIFTTDNNGSTGPIWFYFQPTGNATRFDAGMVHNLRVAVVPTGTSMPFSPMFVGSKTMTALDIPITPRTSGTMDDGAFVKGVADTTYSGNMFLLYDNTDGSGDPLYSFQIRTITAFTTFANIELPGTIDSNWRELPAGVKGEFAAVIPISENNPNGLRRVEVRDMQNNMLTFVSDQDGVWPSGANSTTVARRDVLYLNTTDLVLSSTITGKITYNNSAETPMDSTYVYLYDMNNNLVKTVITNSTGEYNITGVNLGTYKLMATSQKIYGGINSIDALAILRHFVGLAPLTGLRLKAGDVSGGIPVVNSADALMVQKRFVGLINEFPIGDWVSETPQLTVSEVGTQNIDFKIICAGDVNASYIPW